VPAGILGYGVGALVFARSTGQELLGLVAQLIKGRRGQPAGAAAE
jgi:hypothetical protein